MSACAGADAIARNASAASEAAGICQRRTAPLPAGGGVQFDDAAEPQEVIFRMNVASTCINSISWSFHVQPHGWTLPVSSPSPGLRESTDAGFRRNGAAGFPRAR